MFFALGAAIAQLYSPEGGPMLLATPGQVTNPHGQSVLLSWQNIAPLQGDFIVSTCGKWSGKLDDHLAKGGKLELNATFSSVHSGALINMRCNYTFRYVRNSKVLAQVDVPLGKGLANSPTQGHISFGDGSDEMWVMWVSASGQTPSVRYSTLPGVMSPGVKVSIATGKSGTYSANDMCHAPANQTGQDGFIDPGIIHRVLLTGLRPSTSYFFAYGNEVDGFSVERSFHTRPALVTTTPSTTPAEKTDPPVVRFLAYGDQDWDTGPGASPTTASNCLRDALEAGYSDFLLHFGDIAYAEGTGTDWEYTD
jgi:hypothetical protein